MSALSLDSATGRGSVGGGSSLPSGNSSSNIAAAALDAAGGADEELTGERAGRSSHTDIACLLACLGAGGRDTPACTLSLVRQKPDNSARCRVCVRIKPSFM